MRVGVFIGDATGRRTTVPELIEAARRAEAAGFATGWVPHIPWSLDGLSALALAGMATDRIELGTAVMPTYPRHPLVMAQQALSAQAAAGGRVVLGIGPSHPVVIEKMHGLAYDRPVAHTREYLEVLRLAFAGPGQVVFDGELYHTDALLDVPGASPLPVLLAALAPQMLRLAGSRADGTITYWADERALEDHVVPTISAAAAGAGRAAPRVVAGVPVAVVDDAAGALEQARRIFSPYRAIPTYQRILARGGSEDPASVAVIGDEATALRRLQGFASAGATDICIAILGLGPDAAATRERTYRWLSSVIREL